MGEPAPRRYALQVPVATPPRSMLQAGSSAVYAPGTLIANKYRLEALIGEGGMGEVWLAENTTLHVDVAIKLIRAEIAGSEEAAQRLLNEARAAARIEHHAIVRIHDFGSTERDDPFIVMELLKGRSLDDWLAEDGAIPPTDAVSVLLPVLGALSVAHPKGIVHRDMKPDNIFLAEDEQGVITPKLVDFGIAKMMYGDVESDEIPVEIDVERSEVRERLRTRMTKMGQLLGSPEFMSPEQVRGDRDIDGRADLWGVGVVLYDALTGRRPFAADSEEDMLLAIVSQDPEPIEGLDPELWAVVERALEKSCARRWQDARAMGEALARWLAAQGIEEDVTGRSLKAWLGSTAPPQVRRPSPVPTRMSVARTEQARARSRVVPWIVGLALVGGAVAVVAAIASGGNDDAAAAPAALPEMAVAPAAVDAAETVGSEPDEVSEPAATAGASSEPVVPRSQAARPPTKATVSPTKAAAPAKKRAIEPAPKPTFKEGKLPIPDDVPF